MDVEIASVLKKRPIMKSSDQPNDIQYLKGGIIGREHWSIVYKMKEGAEIKNCVFVLRDKRLYSTSSLNSILVRAEANKSNSAIDIKCVLAMIRWYIFV